MSKRNVEELKAGTQDSSGQKLAGDKKEPDGNKKPKLAFKIGKKTVFQSNKSENMIQKSESKPEPVKSSLREAFNSESESEEEMPPEARMRMRNIGRDTPTSAGPNSFGKTKQGFCDAKKVFEKKLKAAAESTLDS
ncbi:PEST proteolytic signal-containing nuclear protein [Halyomorpha halys]|uniref:PEST proteolytic signal-containing nuclear protein n=1 Tax=Halyomorpha halys TaxID=286706 RepID=UPI0006D5188D|nr:PEST proteolytic signal-containing nuclear protein-like [Halyomorpha halys]